MNTRIIEAISILDAAEHNRCPPCDFSSIVQQYEEQPEWFADALYSVCHKTPAKFKFQIGVGDISCILIDLAECCGWDYEDEGEYSIARFTNLKMQLFIDLEDLTGVAYVEFIGTRFGV